MVFRMIIKRVSENVNRPKMKTFQEKLNRTLVCTLHFYMLGHLSTRKSRMKNILLSKFSLMIMRFLKLKNAVSNFRKKFLEELYLSRNLVQSCDRRALR